MTDEEPLDVVRNGKRSNHRLPIVIALVALSMLLALVLGIAVLSEASADRATLQAASNEGCVRGNKLRREINRQARAFVHHNDATLNWALVVRNVLDRTSPPGEAAFQATAELIQAYRQVRRQYYTVQIIDCSSLDRDVSEPSRPVQEMP